MAMASIYWDMEHYNACERVFRQSAEFCSEHEVRGWLRVCPRSAV